MKKCPKCGYFESKKRGNSEDLEGFETFWGIYPRKEAKGNAEKSWAKINPDFELFTRIVDSVEKHLKSINWLKNDGEFIPLPATFLNQRRWEDQVKLRHEEPKPDMSKWAQKNKELELIKQKEWERIERERNH